MKDVARLADVSVTTVSATLSGAAPVSETLQKRVWDAISEAGYQPDLIARNLRKGTSTTVGLVVPDIAVPWAAHLARAMQQALSDRGYHMLFASSGDDPEREFREIALMMAHKVAGLIIAPTSLGEGYADRFVKTVRGPVVLVDRVLPGTGFDTVTDDNVYGAQLVTRYLLRLGHKQIAFLAGRPTISASYERYDAFRSVLSSDGVEPREELMQQSIFKRKQAYSAVQQLMSLPAPPTAIICLTIAQLKGTMEGLKNMGLRVPDDVSVICFDGHHPAEGWTPSITALSPDIAAHSQQTAKLLLSQFAGNEPRGEVIRIKPLLQIRESCRAIG
ncbi:MAG: LacI family DNA-binding transcriptional regulator [Rhizobiales bacterium]|nr:LacI family DNA-binding transcriptional regulator [Hyphomicrobiales bacterium]MBO6697879.1 LacI family DNA-binding transcriptional regulator [Hyphomicrobiales bacterium]MBO6735867.1 LacI family DNA-binding transcriptional regulator [Hyphomicrobiales bacterium]MBO6913878.1 LacI family DNA-binding transcriptional regulator [Hyphomicrobiales bacterium]MBO6955581.1 LacI family DNA-binding transcriptional regulator [Hyphomicrobiales bacterium]